MNNELLKLTGMIDDIKNSISNKEYLDIMNQTKKIYEISSKLKKYSGYEHIGYEHIDDIIEHSQYIDRNYHSYNNNNRNYYWRDIINPAIENSNRISYRGANSHGTIVGRNTR